MRFMPVAPNGRTMTSCVPRTTSRRRTTRPGRDLARSSRCRSDCSICTRCVARRIEMNLVQRGSHQTIDTATPWEPVMGYSRAVRAGNTIVVTGTVGIMPDGTYPDSMAAQTRRSLEIVRSSIEALGGTIEQVIRTRIFTTDISRWEEIASVHGKVFAEIRPATTLVEVKRLIDERALVEIEADAVVNED